MLLSLTKPGSFFKMSCNLWQGVLNIQVNPGRILMSAYNKYFLVNLSSFSFLKVDVNVTPGSHASEDAGTNESYKLLKREV